MFTLFSHFNLYSQNSSYIKYRKQALELKLANRYLNLDSLNLARKYFINAIKIGDLDYYNSVQATYCFALLNDEKNLVKTVLRLPMKHLIFCNTDSSKYCLLRDDILDDTLISKILNSPRGQKAIQDINNKINVNYSKIDWEVYNELNTIHKLDQEIRQEIMKHWGQDNVKDKDSLNRIMQEVDTKNFATFLNILKEKGWPDMNLYGNLIDVVYFHINVNLGFVDSISLKAAEKKLLDWNTYEHFYKRAMFFDSLFLSHGYAIEMGNNALAEAKLQAATDYLEFYKLQDKFKISLITKCTQMSKNSRKIAQIKDWLNRYGQNLSKIDLVVDNSKTKTDIIIIQLINRR